MWQHEVKVLKSSKKKHKKDWRTSFCQLLPFHATTCCSVKAQNRFLTAEKKKHLRLWVLSFNWADELTAWRRHQLLPKLPLQQQLQQQKEQQQQQHQQESLNLRDPRGSTSHEWGKDTTTLLSRKANKYRCTTTNASPRHGAELTRLAPKAPIRQ